MVRTKLMKQKWFPRPHSIAHSYSHGLETAVVNQATIMPISHYDEGLGAPSAYDANPEHASFVSASSSNTFPKSRIDNIFCQLIFSLTKGALVTDKLHAVRCAFMPIMVSTLQDLQAIDELSSLETQDVLEMTSESSDRQSHALYNDVKMVEKYSGSATLNSAEPGLTTTQVLEGVAFAEFQYYNMAQFMTNAGKLRSMNGGLKWFILTDKNPVKTFNIRIRPKTKRQLPYSSFSVLTYVPSASTINQLPVVADTTNIPHVDVNFTARYLEWNQGYNMEEQG